ncbi:MAG TPA: hypothetical protein VMS88_04135, partial [Terriglobales bacterium]|nr:hypothetical protein [Terriglobales bacterium]
MRLASRVRARSLPRAMAALALCLALAPSARAEIAPKAKPVLDRYLQAMGPAYLTERSLHTRDSVRAFGMKGIAETWMVRPNHVANRIELGPFKMRTGYDGNAGWRTDPSGKVLTLDGKDLEDARGSAWFDGEAWLLPDQGGGR